MNFHSKIYKTCFDGPFHGKTFAPHHGETIVRILTWSEGKYVGDSLYRVDEDKLNYMGHDGTKTWPSELHATNNQKRRPMTDLERIRTMLCELVEEKVVNTWLETPNAKFNNKKPIELIKDGDLKPLEEMIYRLKSGTPV